MFSHEILMDLKNRISKAAEDWNPFGDSAGLNHSTSYINLDFKPF